jgi:hypothetical protein
VLLSFLLLVKQPASNAKAEGTLSTTGCFLAVASERRRGGRTRDAFSGCLCCVVLCALSFAILERKERRVSGFGVAVAGLHD